MDALPVLTTQSEDNGSGAVAPPNPHAAGSPAVVVTECDGFVVVSLWRAKEGDGTSYDYETHTSLNDALDAYRELEDGEYPRARAVGIFAARNGMPVGSRIESAVILRLLRETRAA